MLSEKVYDIRTDTYTDTYKYVYSEAPSDSESDSEDDSKVSVQEYYAHTKKILDYGLETARNEQVIKKPYNLITNDNYSFPECPIEETKPLTYEVLKEFTGKKTDNVPTVYLFNPRNKNKKNLLKELKEIYENIHHIDILSDAPNEYFKDTKNVKDEFYNDDIACHYNFEKYFEVKMFEEVYIPKKNDKGIHIYACWNTGVYSKLSNEFLTEYNYELMYKQLNEYQKMLVYRQDKKITDYFNIHIEYESEINNELLAKLHIYHKR